MSDNLVERLRNEVFDWTLRQEAADEIERLKEAFEHSYRRGYVNGARKTREELGAEIEQLRADFNDCNRERDRWRAEAQQIRTPDQVRGKL